MRINEPCVVYLFSKFHEQLGFEKVLQVQNIFPDCVALQSGKQVSIEFETKSGGLATHMKYDPFNINPSNYEVRETNATIILKERIYSKYPIFHDPIVLSKEKYKLFKYMRSWEIRKLFLDLDYCVAWNVSRSDTTFQGYRNTQFIELKSNPIIMEFMKDMELIK